MQGMLFKILQAVVYHIIRYPIATKDDVKGEEFVHVPKNISTGGDFDYDKIIAVFYDYSIG